MPERPWERRRATTIALHVDHMRGEGKGSNGAIGWAVFGLDRIAAQGEHPLPPNNSDAQAAMEAVLHYRQIVSQFGPQTVELWRYTEKSFGQSHAYSDGMTLKEHDRRIKAVRDALRDEGAKVRMRVAR